MSLSTATPGRARDTAAYLFDLAREAQKEFHDAKRRGDMAEMALMGLLKTTCAFVAAGLTEGGYRVATALDQTHIDLLSVERAADHRDLHVPRDHWSRLRQMRDDTLAGGLYA